MQSPSALSRFAMFFLLGSLVFVLVLLHIMQRLPAPPKGRPAATAHPQAKPAP